jgi:prephenate dehydrogenase
MGGSLAAACRKRFRASRIVGISRDGRALRTALRNHWIHEGTSDLKKGIRAADLVVICTPVDTLKSMLQRIEKAAKPGTLVTDVGSVKGEIVRWAEKRRWKKITFVGAHPMTGSHERGIQVARPDLYRHGFTFVTRSRRNSARAVAAVKIFWKAISPRVVVISADEHDKITGEISHLPHLLAVCLTLTAHEKSLKHVGPGFLDATRIAEGHPSIWTPIFRSNRTAVRQALQRFQAQCRVFQKALQSPGRTLEKMLAQARSRRRQISL